METVLQAKNVRKIYGSKGNVYTALENISIDIKEGEFTGIMGPSGAGKSTLLNVLSTIDKPTSGEIRISGQELENMNEQQMSTFRRDKLGFIFQDYNLLDTLTIRENIILPLALAKRPVKEMEAKLATISTKFGITDILDKYPNEISGGQKQRTAASRAIITSPSLIFADEPTGALDSKSATNLLESLRDLNEQDKATIMMVTHDAFAASFCKRILFIKDGELYTEIYRGSKTRKEFFQKILDVLAKLGGDTDDVI
ncbi:ABC transporter ATP-binding protein [Listeria cossartiae subsp. cayugensis]|uniref:ABC transporter ATP-binding protein n=1 Tax=Listeria cossartiae TaxID=2838249 RepID=UPI0028805363|nr:ABC transporter ATP-binding protein [Listeria cossartiae]MDT0003623.1 ABC transporter ATP-binding protein [Listeria cossartiae subsp. cayugensis]MDT0020017.1 ABC transporter ATP-binding protein [Listeria cossartiae subsp. cayugensis]MDT0036897.1 ABC transporter ATP-binding protein [Listeria cossartiae subsp. cayugensis]MDT0041768.1 ABC transporter ATP-binding protein [Listeria cossartiae subsp. cayugensis]MDT0047119.1 ABC transporter ATP-binding protein [Listeria cossartiae subsp. cayugensi